MASISTPLIFSQSSPYIRGTITYKWFDADAVSAITGGNASANGISSITLNQSSANLVIAFDSNSSATVDIEGATSSLALTVPDDYNENITVDVISELEVGKTHDVTTPVKKTIRHQFTGISDSTLTSSISNPQFNETEVVAGTGKSLGTYSVNDVDSSVTYTATVTYDKTIGSITYTDNSVVTNNSANDQIVTNSVSTLNHVLTTMAYVPLFQSNPSQNTDALQGQTITLAVENTKDKKINSQPVTISTTIDNTLQLTNSGPAPSFLESDGSSYNATAKSIGAIGISPSLNIPGTTFTANVTYDRAKGTITYPNSSIVTTQGSVDTISSSDIANINDALSNCTYVPTTISSGEDLERIESDTIQIAVSSTPQLTIATPTTEVTTQITNNELEIENANTFIYTKNTTTNTIFPDLGITDTADNDAGTTEIYAMVFKPTQGATLTFLTSFVYTVALYEGNNSTTNIPSNSFVIQGTKQNVNDWLDQNEIRYNPKPNNFADDTIQIDLYRAPDGTAYDVNINNDANFALFEKIHQGSDITISNTGGDAAATTLKLQDHGRSTMNYNFSTNTITNESFVEATTWGALDGGDNMLPTPRIHFVSPRTENLNLKITIDHDDALTNSELGSIDFYNATSGNSDTNIQGDFDQPSSTYTDLAVRQGGHITGGDGGVNEASHKNFRDVFFRHTMGTLSDASDERTANLTYTVLTTDNTISSNITIPYLIVKNGSFDGTTLDTSSSSQPFPNDNEFMISMWMYTPSDSVFVDTTNHPSYTTRLWQAGDTNFTAHPFYVSGLIYQTGQASGSGQIPFRTFAKLVVQTSSTEGFSADVQIGTGTGNPFTSNGWNHLVWGGNLANRDWEFGVNGKAYSIGGGNQGGLGPVLSYPTTWPTGLSDATSLQIAAESNTHMGHIQITDDFEAGDINASGAYGSGAGQFVTIEDDPNTSGELLRPVVRSGMHGFINGSATSFRIRGNIGGSVTGGGSAGNLITTAPLLT